MTGIAYLKGIHANIVSGKKQHRKGQNLLRAFGYTRRRGTAIEEINDALDTVGLKSVPIITTDMPLKIPFIRFELKDQLGISNSNETGSGPEVSENEIDDGDSDLLQDVEDIESSLPEPSFKVSELISDESEVECVSPSEAIEHAYSIMLYKNYSQLVIADNKKPMQQAIKRIVSFRSMTKALIKGDAQIVGDCIDTEVPILSMDADLNEVIAQLKKSDVVLVIGKDKRLQGIVTAWDLADEFAILVDPFKRLGEIEARLRILVEKKLGKDNATQFLLEHVHVGEKSVAEIEEMTLGELQWIIDYPQHWDKFALQFDRNVFVEALNTAREFRNRLMHFRDPLNAKEMSRLTNFCVMVREIQL